MDTITSLFVVPAALGVLAFWSIWRLVRLLDLPLSARRTLFVLLGTLMLAPMLVPVATILTALVPHGMLILMMPTELLGYYLQVARYVFPSFAVTALFFGLIVVRWVKADTRRLQPNWATFLVPIFVVLLTVATYRYAFPSNEIPLHLNNETMEAVYGQRLEEVIALLEIDNADEQGSAIMRLNALFQSDSSVLEVSLRVPTQQGTYGDPERSYNQTFYYMRGESRAGGSSYGRPNTAQGQGHLQRWTWRYGVEGLFFAQCSKQWLSIVRKCDTRDVLKYLRPFTYRQESQFVRVVFDYEEVLQAFDR